MDGHLSPSARRAPPSWSSLALRRKQPSKPLRTNSEGDVLDHGISSPPPISHTRHKSTSLASGASRSSVKATRRGSEHIGHASIGHKGYALPASIPEAPEQSGLFSPPITPVKEREMPGAVEADPGAEMAAHHVCNEALAFDFSKIDFELERARQIGTGLWSNVYLADAKMKSPPTANRNIPSPPATPDVRLQVAPSSVFAVKAPARRDAKSVFQQEAKVLSHLMGEVGARNSIVPFLGLDSRYALPALVFEAVLGGSLENLNSRLRQTTEVARHIELVNLFPGLADDLISGLDFLHSARVVHADIKPANILLDISEHYSLPRPVVRARYIDFSASFRLESQDSTTNSGGTWDYLAPEQMSTKPELNTPTFASDVWSLGITLLYLIVGDSPYAAACGDNRFALREAIKGGDPLAFARSEPTAQKRMAACQNFIDCCRVALKKERKNRVEASDWKEWVGVQDMGV